jgi:hypothetical protein
MGELVRLMEEASVLTGENEGDRHHEETRQS